MIVIDSFKTVEILVNSFDILKERWGSNMKNIFTPLKDEYRHHNFNETVHDVDFIETKNKKDDRLKILFSHFSLMKYEMEALELPLYASKFLPNSKIDICYFDTRKSISKDGSKIYLASVNKGKVTSPKDNFLDEYDLVITKSNTLLKMKNQIPDVFNRSKTKINIQTNNYSPNFNLGEDYFFSHKDFYAPPGRKFTDRANSLIKESKFKKCNNLFVMTGTICWWKGQLEWIQAIDPNLLKDCYVLMLGKISDLNYFKKIISIASQKNINLLYSDFVNPKFLCDILSISKIKIMNHYMDPPMQPEGGPARTFGEALGCKCICIHGQKYFKDGRPTTIIPEEWKKFTFEFNQNHTDEFNTSFEKALNSNLDVKLIETVENKCENILEKCLEVKNND